MAGVGPFAVPLTAAKFKKHGIVVHANDLNPSSYHYLKVNMVNNKCSQLTPYQMDGRAFVHYLQDEATKIDFHHAIMNLPATAPAFLNAFRGYTNPTLPQIHVHCFGGKDVEKGPAEVIARCSKALGCDLTIGGAAKVHLVRNVAPKKNMYCVSFVLPEAARLLPRIVIEEPPPIAAPDDCEEVTPPDAKKARIDE
jgi:tRNA (guanine37-N1)-methyltransferase